MLNTKFKKITEKDVQELEIICGGKNVFTGKDIHEDYSHDELAEEEIFPEVLVIPKDAKQISKIMKYAYENNISVTPRGQGTGLVGGAVPINGGILLSTEELTKILDLDRDNLTLTVESGVLLMDIVKYVKENNFLYPPDPGEKSASIGGNISTNAGGMQAVKYGVTRDHILELEIVLPDGEIIKLGGKIVKDTSGYSLKDLIIGSEGTLGIITKAVLRLVPLPLVNISLLIPFKDMDTAIETVPKIIRSKNVPVAIEYMERRVIKDSEDYLGKKFPDSSSDAYLLLKFDGNTKEEVEKQYEKVAQICLDAGAIDVLISDTEERDESIWTARGAFLEAIKGSTTKMDECDVVVPRDKVAEFIKYTKFVEKEIEIRISSFGHAGDGNLHVYLLKDEMSEEEFQNKLTKAFNLLYSKGEELGGHVSGEHGIGYAKKEYLEKAMGSVYMNLLKGIKDVFDPKGILNPGKIC
ncbi:MAG: FAD-binding oxidoreductase [Candidatus Marinimicrobia bacterium]|nr:FAD-binding oxidoreductase [Candidatus Neomarinimicrobiota bacterium]